MKAIPTIYRGVEFKSRLEANTAAFFDQHGIAWQYEPQSFLLEPGLHYWPDFYLSDLDTWVECKGVMDELSRTRIERFAQMIITGELGRTDLSGEVAWPKFLLVASEECRFWVCLKKCPAELVHAYKIEKASRAGIGRCKHC